MANDDLIRSEVHPTEIHSRSQDHTSHFVILNQRNDVLSVAYQVERQGEPSLDEDGDWLLQRLPRQHAVELLIHHATSTPLDEVGLQVWHGSLLLAEYILCHQDQFSGCTGLEVAAGTGLAGIVMAVAARRVFITDCQSAVLANCRRNVSANCHHFSEGPDVVKVRRLDVSSATPRDPGRQDGGASDDASSHVAARDDDEEAFSWQPEDIEELNAVQVILAADIVYDNDLTEEFMCCMERFLEARVRKNGPPLRLLVAVEKRINFTLRSMCPTADAYDFFRSLFTADEECSNTVNNPSACNARAKALHGRQMPTGTIVQQFNYSRSTDLELWDIRLSSRCSTPS